MKLIVPAEQALSMPLFAAQLRWIGPMPAPRMRESWSRILTPLLKFRACRDNIPVATGAMEVRGGNGYIEEWVNARLVRDAHVGLLWEGTSNINALDIITRAVGKSGAHRALRRGAAMRGSTRPQRCRRFSRSPAPRVGARARLRRTRGSRERSRDAGAARRERAVSCDAARSCWRGKGQPGVDARRALLARFVLEHRLDRARSAGSLGRSWEREAIELVLGDAPASLARVASLLDFE